ETLALLGHSGRAASRPWGDILCRAPEPGRSPTSWQGDGGGPAGVPRRAGQRLAAGLRVLVDLLLQLLELGVRVLLGHGLVELLLELVGRRELVERGLLGLGGRRRRSRGRRGRGGRSAAGLAAAAAAGQREHRDGERARRAVHARSSRGLPPPDRPAARPPPEPLRPPVA